VAAGGALFHNGLTFHGAGANMTPRARRAMTAGFMPEDATFNGIQNILSPERVARLRIGDPLADDDENPVVYSTKATTSAQ
jgi:ectoine hydroxylase-related dioxygenase (phytanoyl-CoA dioxygenase family)